ncbi:hypothetical protein FACS1894182_10440 [Bacteroidia bacterium]|nr:hypothetical protein FACS1894182_10440 [Bacteroidia bacterium]
MEAVKKFYQENQSLFTHFSFYFSEEQGERINMAMTSDCEDKDSVYNCINHYFTQFIRIHPSETIVELSYGKTIWIDYPNNSIVWNAFNIPPLFFNNQVFRDFAMYSALLITQLYDTETSEKENRETVAAFLGVNLCKSVHLNTFEIFQKNRNECPVIEEELSNELRMLDSYWNWTFDSDEQEIATIFISWLNAVELIYILFNSEYGFYTMLSIIEDQLNINTATRQTLFFVIKQWFEIKNRNEDQTKYLYQVDNVLTLSFCITCKNRFHQIVLTLKQNLDDNRVYKNKIEFVLVDFGSTDGLRDWIIENFKDDLYDGYLKYYYTEELPFWHASIAKNTAHLLANNEILVNLDCDNYTGYTGGEFVLRQFSQYPEKMLFHQFSGNNGDGSFGRISMHHHCFFNIGGYDESLEPMSMQDEDLIKRLRANGVKYTHCPDRKYNKAIFNTKEEGILYTGSDLKYINMFIKNQQISNKNLLDGKFVANGGKWGIRKNIFDINGSVMEIENKK